MPLTSYRSKTESLFIQTLQSPEFSIIVRCPGEKWCIPEESLGECWQIRMIRALINYYHERAFDGPAG